jgi:glycosyltransferase involved in cell wall biosynthesis
LFRTFNFKERLKIFFKKKNKTSDDWYEFISALFGGFPELKTFGNRAKTLLNKSSYDVVIDNQSLSYGMIEVQKNLPLIEIIHHPITKDYRYDIQFSKGIIQKLSKWRWFSFLKMQKRVSLELKVISTPSHNSKKDIVRDFGVLEKNISVIPNGIDHLSFSPLQEINRVPSQIITTASADVPLKGLDFTLHAVARLKEDYPQLKLVIIGSPKSGGHTERLIKRLQIDQNILYRSNLSRHDIAVEYAKSNVAIVSSLYEGFGFPVGEAMSCAIPLIATNVASIPEITQSFAELIPAESSDAIESAIRKIFVNPETSQLRADAGRIHIKENFDWQKIAKSYEDLIYKTIDKFQC